MIFFNLTITNPFSSRFSIVFSKFGRTFIQNKFWELNIYRTADILNISFDITWKTADHSGVRIALGLFSVAVEGHIYDNRHGDQRD